MKINIKEIFAGIVIIVILVLLLNLTFFRKGNEAGTIPVETMMKLDSLQKSSDELKIKNAALEEKIRAFEEDENNLEVSKESIKQNFSQKKSNYESLKADDKETEFKNYIKISNPDLYKKLYGDK